MPRSFMVKSKRAHSYHQPRSLEDDYSRLDTILEHICSGWFQDRQSLSPAEHNRIPAALTQLAWTNKSNARDILTYWLVFFMHMTEASEMKSLISTDATFLWIVKLFVDFEAIAANIYI